MLKLGVFLQNLRWRLAQRLERLVREEDGLSMLEYVMLAAFLLLVLLGAVTLVAPELRDWVEETMNDLMSGKGR